MFGANATAKLLAESLEVDRAARGSAEARSSLRRNPRVTFVNFGSDARDATISALEA
jgi:hypothetical protein